MRSFIIQQRSEIKEFFCLADFMWKQKTIFLTSWREFLTSFRYDKSPNKSSGVAMLGKSSTDRLLRPEGRVGKPFPALLIELEALEAELDAEDEEDSRLWTLFFKSLTSDWSVFALFWSSLNAMTVIPAFPKNPTVAMPYYTSSENWMIFAIFFKTYCKLCWILSVYGISK